MSLINDALKRAKQAQKENPPPPPALQFKPAGPAQPRSAGPPILLIVAGAVVLSLVGWFVVTALPKRETAHALAHAKQPDESTVQTAAPSLVTPAANSVPAQPPVPVTAQSQPAPAAIPPAVLAQPLSTNSALAAGNPATAPAGAPTDSATNDTAAAVDATPPKPALPRLQGIFYRPARPSAVINGKNVFIGSRVGEFQVLAITQQSVTIGSATQTNILSLE
jgi:hypothetical protein